MLQARTVRPADLDPVELSAWSEFQRAEPAWRSPLLSPAFAQAVGAVRSDAAVAVLRRDGEIVGFLPHHRRAGALGRPIGSPFADYHALIAAPGAVFDAREALKAARLSAFGFSGLIDPQERFAGAVRETEPAYAVRLEGDAAAYLERRRAASAKKFKNWRRLEHKAERELGPLSLGEDVSPAAFEQILDWKRAQLRATGRHDFLRAAWTERLMRSVFDRREPAFAGLLLSLRAGDRLLAGHFGVRSEDWFHPWIASRDPALPDYSLGQTFLWRAIAAMPALGLRVYDLGPGHEHYKRPFASDEIVVARGAATALSPAGRAAASIERAVRLAERPGAPKAAFVASARRRLEHIGDVETTLTGWIGGVAHAVTGRSRARPDEGFA